MVWHGWERDPRADPAASNVLAAYRDAVKARVPTVDCYRAGVEAWRTAHPDQSKEYSAKQAVAVILAVKARFLLHVPDE
jgi:hypothetical protein